MKKTCALILSLVIIFALSACGDSAVTPEVANPIETYVPAEPSAVNEAGAVDVPASPEPAMKAEEISDAVDVDLTKLSSTMVYSEVYAMVYEPEQYMGKTVKMNGLFSSFEGAAGQVYYTCIVQDATACCAQGLEFELRDVDGYPEHGTEITVIGTFDTYQEEYNGNYYLYIILRDAELV